MWRKRPEDQPPYANRVDAGRKLADALAPLVADVPRERLVALGLARGGVVLSAEIGHILDIATDALVVRKIGAPMQPELAIGAVGPDGHRLLNRPLIDSLGLTRSDVETLALAASRERDQLDHDLRRGREFPALADRTVILVDDGLATGASMRAAWGYVARETPSIILAVPVAPPDAINAFEHLGAQIVCPIITARFGSVGTFYRDFGEVTSSMVRSLLDPDTSDPAGASGT